MSSSLKCSTQNLVQPLVSSNGAMTGLLLGYQPRAPNRIIETAVAAKSGS
jgi:hypothetical protein